MASGGKAERQAVNALIGQRIKIRRKALGWTQSDLGRRLGVSFQQIQKYELGQNRVNVALLHQICGALQVGILYFWNGLSDPREAGGEPDGLCTVPRSAVDALIAAARQIDDVLRMQGKT